MLSLSVCIFVAQSGMLLSKSVFFLTGSSGQPCCPERLWDFWSTGFPHLGKCCAEMLPMWFSPLHTRNKETNTNQIIYDKKKTILWYRKARQPDLALRYHIWIIIWSNLTCFVEKWLPVRACVVSHVSIERWGSWTRVQSIPTLLQGETGMLRFCCTEQNCTHDWKHITSRSSLHLQWHFVVLVLKDSFLHPSVL